MKEYWKPITKIAEELGKPTKEFLRRADGRVEWTCSHGVGHTVWFPENSDEIHGCDGCCSKLKREKEE